MMLNFSELLEGQQKFLRNKYEDLYLLLRLESNLTLEIVSVLLEGYDECIVEYQWERFISCDRTLTRWLNGMDGKSITSVLYVLHYSDDVIIATIREG